MKLGYSPYSFPGSINPFNAVFSEWERLDYTPAKACDAIILWGGTDINPKYYGEKPHPMNGYMADSERDQNEWGWMNDAVLAGVPIIGVCRGAQFVCVKAGGKLIQHMKQPHYGRHQVICADGGDYMMENDHHQAMIVDGTEHTVIAWSHDNVPEIVHFPNIKGLALQGHPEWEEANAPIVEYQLGLVRKLIEGTL